MAEAYLVLVLRSETATPTETRCEGVEAISFANELAESVAKVKQSFYLKTICQGLECKPSFLGNLSACQEQGEAASDQAFRRDQNPYPIHLAENRFWDYSWTNSLVELSGGRK